MKSTRSVNPIDGSSPVERERVVATVLFFSSEKASEERRR